MKRYRSFALFLFVLVMTLAGCAGNVQPGDCDFPQANGEASNVLTVHGAIDPGLPVKFAAFWVSTKDWRLPVADGNCNYWANYIEGVAGTYTMYAPLTPTMHGNAYTVDVKTDAFLPGRCGWKFSGLLVYTNGQTLKDRGSVESAELLVEAFDEKTLPNWAGMIRATGNRLDVSCETATDPIEHPNDKAYLDCVDTVSKRIVRLTLRDSDLHSVELNIHRGNRPN